MHHNGRWYCGHGPLILPAIRAPPDRHPMIALASLTSFRRSANRVMVVLSLLMLALTLAPAAPASAQSVTGDRVEDAAIVSYSQAVERNGVVVEERGDWIFVSYGERWRWVPNLLGPEMT